MMLETWLHSSSLAWLLTLGSYYLALRIYQRWSYPWLQPVLITIALIITALSLLDYDYALYFQQVNLLHQLLGLATVALAIPLYKSLPLIQRLWGPITISLFIGLAGALGLSLLLAYALGVSSDVLLAMTSKSVTTPIAIALAEHMGAIPALAAAFVMITGLTGAILGPPLMQRLGLTHEAAQGFALGLCAHGIGTARAYELSESSAAFAGLALSLTGLLCACALPFIVPFFIHFN